jgi:hypothetical protein
MWSWFRLELEQTVRDAAIAEVQQSPTISHRRKHRVRTHTPPHPNLDKPPGLLGLGERTLVCHTGATVTCSASEQTLVPFPPQLKAEWRRRLAKLREEVARLVEAARNAPATPIGANEDPSRPLLLNPSGEVEEEDDLDDGPLEAQRALQQAEHVGPWTVAVEVALILAVFTGLATWAVLSAEQR